MPIVAAGCFDLSSSALKEALARQLWLGYFRESMLAVREANPLLVEVLAAQVGNTHDRRTGAGFVMYDMFFLPMWSTAGLRPLAGAAPARSRVNPGRRSGRQQISAPPASCS